MIIKKNEGCGISGIGKSRGADHTNFWVELVATVVVKEFGLKIFKLCDVVEGDEVESESRCAESISRISVDGIWYRKSSYRPLRIALNVGTDD